MEIIRQDMLPITVHFTDLDIGSVFRYADPKDHNNVYMKTNFGESNGNNAIHLNTQNSYCIRRDVQVVQQQITLYMSDDNWDIFV